MGFLNYKRDFRFTIHRYFSEKTPLFIAFDVEKKILNNFVTKNKILND